MDQGLYLRGWFREDGLRGQNLNMFLTIITINNNYTVLFLIRSQINNIIIKKTLTVKGPRKIIINCSSWVVPLHTFSSLVTYFNSGCAAKAFYSCPAIISRRPRSQNTSKEPQLNPEKDSRRKRARSHVSLEKSS